MLAVGNLPVRLKLRFGGTAMVSEQRAWQCFDNAKHRRGACNHTKPPISMSRHYMADPRSMLNTSMLHARSDCSHLQGQQIQRIALLFANVVVFRVASIRYAQTTAISTPQQAAWTGLWCISLTTLKVVNMFRPKGVSTSRLDSIFSSPSSHQPLSTVANHYTLLR